MISIVTPSFGQIDWLRLCVASVADQVGVEREHIVQDAGTAEISEERIASTIAAKDYRLRLHIERDAGMYDAINRGLKKAGGEICAYLNCDEQYLPGALQRVSEFFEAHREIDVLFGDVILVDRDGHPLSYRRSVLPTASHVRLVHLNTSSCSMFFRRHLVGRGFLFDTRWKAIGDVAWVHALLRENIRMQVLREPLAVFTFTGKNLGATALSTAELARFREGARFAPLARPATILRHRLQKFLAGAYRPHSVDFEIYTLNSPHQRQRQGKTNLGFGWPATTSLQP